MPLFFRLPEDMRFQAGMLFLALVFFPLFFAPHLAFGALPGAIYIIPTEEKKSAMTAISGSPYPGVIDHVLQRPLPEEDPAGSSILINYPSLGNKDVDADIRAWVQEIADAFTSHLDTELQLPESEYFDIDAQIDAFLHDDDLNSDTADEDNKRRFELFGTYSVSRPSSAAVSITFELWNYTNNTHGNLDIITLNYNLHNDQRLSFVDIFEKPEVALELMSAWSREKLSKRLASLGGSKSVSEGTAPLIENFSSLTLTPEGIRINFQPFQVAPWDAGIQKVDIPLEELLPSSPLLALWGK